MAETPAQVALLPCPHCGEAEHIYPAYRVDKDGKCHSPYAIDCIGCGYDFTPREGMDVFAAWNRRASLSAEAGDDGQGALVERLRKAADEMREEGQNGWPVTCDDAADRIEALTRENAALRADKEQLRTFAHEATKAITGLTAGGSENFGGEVDGIYLADLPLCVERIRARFATPKQKATEAKVERLERERDEARELYIRRVRRAAIRAERRLAEQGQAQAVDCDRCAGNGEIVTDWDRYLHDGDVGDEAVAACPDCFGVGTVTVTPPSPEPDAELEETRKQGGE